MEERIQYLFRKYLQGACSREEYEELFHLIAEEGGIEALPALLQQQYAEELSRIPSATQVDAYGKLVAGPPAAPAASKRRRVLLPLASLALVAALVIGYRWQGQKPPAPASVLSEKELVRATTIRSTARSEYKYILLPDSTQVWLNAASTLEYPDRFDPYKREVVLKGEAYFDVKHADKKPFIIYTGKVSTEVLGTAFNIKAYPDMEKITVSVKRGKVKVNYDHRQVALLTKGQEVMISSDGLAARERKVKEELASAWHEGNLVYDDYTITDLITDLARVYDARIEVRDPAIRQLRVSTSLKREMGLDKALEIICKLTDTNLKTENGSYIIY